MSEKLKKRTLVQSLFNGKIETDMLIPFPKFDKEELEEMSIVLDMVNKFVKEEIDAAKIDKEHKIPDSVKQGMAELGLWGFIIPEKYGGFEQPEFTYNKVLEALTGTCGATAVMFGGHLSIGLKAILLFGTEEQKQKFLPELASGEKLAGFALTEPNAGSDAQGIQTTAVLSDDGTYYTMNGRKQWITNGGFADIFTVFAKVQEPGKDIDSSKITAFIVFRDSEGVSSGKEEDKLGICGSSTTPLYFDSVKVPAENVLGEIGGGFNIAMAVLNTGRLGLGAGCVGTSRALIKNALDFAQNRKQFNKYITEFGMVEEKFGQMAVDTFTIESMVYYTTFLKQECNLEASVESAICKVFGSEVLGNTAAECLQIAGGNGFMKEYPFERFFRDSRINMIFEGANEILRMMISVTGLQRPSVVLKKYLKQLPENENEKQAKIDEICKEILAARETVNIEGFSEELKGQVDFIEKMSLKFYETVVRAVLTFGREVRESQYLHKRLADAVIHIYGLIANLVRTENLLKNNHHSAKNALLLSGLFAKQAKRKIDQNLHDIFDNFDPDIMAAAKILYDAEKYPFEILEY